MSSSHRVVPESPYSSDAASSSLLVAWYLKQLVAPSQRWLQKLVVVQLHRSLCCGFKAIYILQLLTIKLLTVVVSYDSILCTFVVTVYREFSVNLTVVHMK